MKSLNKVHGRLSAMLLLTLVFFMVEIIVGYITNSMALVADSFHMFSDAICLVIAFISVRMSPKKWSKNTFGWARAEILGALVNAVFLCALCFSILIESIKRFIKPDVIHEPQLILLVGGMGLFINLVGLLLFKDHAHLHHAHHHGHHHHKHSNKDHHDHRHRHISHDQEHRHDHKLDQEHTPIEVHCDDVHLSTDRIQKVMRQHSSSEMNMRGVFLHVMADALGSVIVMISALVVMNSKSAISMYIDPILSVFMVCLILKSTWPLLTESAMILLQTVPTHIEVDLLRRRLTEEIPGVLAVHEFHVWQLAGDRIIASAHIRCHNLQDYMRIAERVKEFFHNAGIHSTTIQPEFIDIENRPSDDEGENNCVLDCPPTQRPSCAPQTCCGLKKVGECTSTNAAPTSIVATTSMGLGATKSNTSTATGSSTDEPRSVTFINDGGDNENDLRLLRT